MSGQAIFSDAFTLRPPIILRRQLQPLSLGHAAVGDAIGLPYITGERTPTLEDCAAASWIFSFTFAQLREMDIDWPSARSIKKWVRNCADLDLPTEMERMEKYVADYLTFPEYWEPDEPEARREGGAPWYYTIAVALMGTGIAEKDVWDLAVNYAAALYGTAAEAKGLDLMTAQDMDDIRKMEELNRVEA